MFYVFLFSEAAEWEGAQLPNLLCYYYNFHQGKTHFNTLWFRSGALYACCLEIGSLEPYDFCFKVQLLFFFLPKLTEFVFHTSILRVGKQQKLSES